MVEKVSLLLFLVCWLVSCGQSGVQVSPTVVVGQATATVAPSAIAIRATETGTERATPTAEATSTDVPTRTATRTETPITSPTPLPTSTPVVIAPETKYGPFTLHRVLPEKYYPAVAPREIPIPSWMSLSEEETNQYKEIEAVYLALPNTPNGSFEKSYEDFLSLTDEFIAAHPDSDSAILMGMLGGHGYNFGLLNNNEGTWHKYFDPAVQLLLKRHPERLKFLLDDLIDLGLRIYKIGFVENTKSGDQALVFGVTVEGDYSGGTQVFIYSLVQRSGGEWAPQQLPFVVSTGSDENFDEIQQLVDMDRDGTPEAIVSSEHFYGSHSDVQPHVFHLENGEWKDLVDWESVTYKGAEEGAYGGDYWLEDTNHDHINEIVVSYERGPGPFLPVIDIYQWNPKGRVFSRDLPITSGQCGYHAFAEAERLNRLGQKEAAKKWYIETRKRWLAEIKSPMPECARGPKPNQPIVNYAFQQQMAMETGIRERSDFVEFLVNATVLPGRTISTTNSITSTKAITTEYSNLFQCLTPECRSVAHYYEKASYLETFPTGESVFCYSGRLPDDDGEYTIDNAKPFILSSIWYCEHRDKNKEVDLKLDGIRVINVCTWDGERFKLAGSRTIATDPWIWGEPFSIIKRAESNLPTLVDCSGDEP